MGTKPDLTRVRERPDPSQWDDAELLTLPEAAELMWPKGPLSTASLRTAARDGQLVISVIAGKHLTTKAALKALATPTPHPGGRSGDPPREQERLSARNVVDHIAAAAAKTRAP